MGLALLFDLGLQLQARSIRQGLEQEADLLRRAEAVLESVRAGFHPLAAGSVEPELAWPHPPEREVLMLLEVEATDLDDVCRVRVWGSSADARGRRHDVTLETLVWKRGAPCP